MELQSRVKDMVATKFNIDSNMIESQTHFFSDLGADSLEMLSFVTEIESEFSVVVSSDELENFYCLENIINFLLENKVMQF